MTSFLPAKPAGIRVKFWCKHQRKEMLLPWQPSQANFYLVFHHNEVVFLSVAPPQPSWRWRSHFLQVKYSWHIWVRQHTSLTNSLKSTLLLRFVSRSRKMRSMASLSLDFCRRGRKAQTTNTSGLVECWVGGAKLSGGHSHKPSLQIHSAAAPSAPPCSGCSCLPPCRRIWRKRWWGEPWPSGCQTCWRTNLKTHKQMSTTTRYEGRNDTREWWEVLTPGKGWIWVCRWVMWGGHL